MSSPQNCSAPCLDDVRYDVGAKDTSKSEADAAKAAEKARLKAERDAQLAAEGGGGAIAAPVASGGAPVEVKCKDCKKMYKKTKKGCPHCLKALLG